MDQMLKSHRCFHLNKEGFVLLNHSIAFQGNKPLMLALLYISKYTNSQSLLKLVLQRKLILHCK
ncbi:hypothetical protein BpHYR1_046025 [Brachionus plicatilis]|uniref:Uncharacterized protein n=1 Tax=Brachionus plicatilis TaxID=10195 RepID=A0A3M7Q769_BRAPC|nr:hypothetical protein BpHYR1_046025 [Brachionus plicatilis]